MPRVANDEDRKFFEQRRLVRAMIQGHAIQSDADDVSGSFPCPVCGDGKMEYTVSAGNGHVHARCTTGQCISWIE